MYFMALGLLLKGDPSVVSGAGLSQEVLANVSVGGYLHNLIPVTIGNMIGGVFFVAVFYFLVFRTNLEDIG
ncbi:MAG TPA: FdhC protein, partial [Synergistaceae bacterium]|jgi:formate/nitrite transporter FocA (FNT family)|nr:FdhC protein [Synergistaceae bacterium]